jgi:hypothetical protein
VSATARQESSTGFPSTLPSDPRRFEQCIASGSVRAQTLSPLGNLGTGGKPGDRKPGKPGDRRDVPKQITSRVRSRELVEPARNFRLLSPYGLLIVLQDVPSRAAALRYVMRLSNSNYSRKSSHHYKLSGYFPSIPKFPHTVRSEGRLPTLANQTKWSR